MRRYFIRSIAGAILIAASATGAQTNSLASREDARVTHAESYALAKRWAQLFVHLLQEFRADDRDPTATLQGDFSTRDVRILLSPDSEDDWVGASFTVEELATADLRRVARELYQAWRLRS